MRSATTQTPDGSAAGATSQRQWRPCREATRASGSNNPQAAFRKDANAQPCREDPNGQELTFERERVNIAATRGAKVGANVRRHRTILTDIRRRQAVELPASFAQRRPTIHSKNSSRDGGVRTRDLLLPNQFHSVAGRGLVSPGVAFTWDDALHVV
jgi:hypothetical protein